jgi:hypothetical protein
MDPVVVAISSTYVPASAAAQQAGAALLKRKVEYGSGVVVTSAGHIVTDKSLTDDCQVVTVAGHGGADRIAHDEASGLALLRLYGARGLKPLPLAEAGVQPDAVTLVGVADPQAQAGGTAVSTVAAKVGGPRGVEPAPALGFAGAAVTDGRGRMVGIVDLKVPVVARAGNGAAPLVAVTPAEALRKFLQAQKVSPEVGAEGDPKASVVRVICVRK